MDEREVVFNTITNYYKNKDLKFDGSIKLNKDQINEVASLIPQFADKGLKYWTGCISNWLKKDERLSGVIQLRYWY